MSELKYIKVEFPTEQDEATLSTMWDMLPNVLTEPCKEMIQEVRDLCKKNPQHAGFYYQILAGAFVAQLVEAPQDLDMARRIVHGLLSLAEGKSMSSEQLAEARSDD